LFPFYFESRVDALFPVERRAPFPQSTAGRFFEFSLFPKRRCAPPCSCSSFSFFLKAGVRRPFAAPFCDPLFPWQKAFLILFSGPGLSVPFRFCKRARSSRPYLPTFPRMWVFPFATSLSSPGQGPFHGCPWSTTFLSPPVRSLVGGSLSKKSEDGRLKWFFPFYVFFPFCLTG